MAKVRTLNKNTIAFFCPGCQEHHTINNTWAFNGDLDRPTFTPSVLVRGTRLTVSHDESWALLEQGVKELPHINTVCHCFVTDGKIQYLNDSTHELAGKTVDLPDIDLG